MTLTLKQESSDIPIRATVSLSSYYEDSVATCFGFDISSLLFEIKIETELSSSLFSSFHIFQRPYTAISSLHDALKNDIRIRRINLPDFPTVAMTSRLILANFEETCQSLCLGLTTYFTQLIAIDVIFQSHVFIDFFDQNKSQVPSTSAIDFVLPVANNDDWQEVEIPRRGDFKKRLSVLNAGDEILWKFSSCGDTITFSATFSPQRFQESSTDKASFSEATIIHYPTNYSSVENGIYSGRYTAPCVGECTLQWDNRSSSVKKVKFVSECVEASTMAAGLIAADDAAERREAHILHGKMGWMQAVVTALTQFYGHSGACKEEELEDQFSAKAICERALEVIGRKTKQSQELSTIQHIELLAKEINFLEDELEVMKASRDSILTECALVKEGMKEEEKLTKELSMQVKILKEKLNDKEEIEKYQLKEIIQVKHERDILLAEKQIYKHGSEELKEQVRSLITQLEKCKIESRERDFAIQCLGKTKALTSEILRLRKEKRILVRNIKKQKLLLNDEEYCSKEQHLLLEHDYYEAHLVKNSMAMKIKSLRFSNDMLMQEIQRLNSNIKEVKVKTESSILKDKQYPQELGFQNESNQENDTVSVELIPGSLGLLLNPHLHDEAVVQSYSNAAINMERLKASGIRSGCRIIAVNDLDTSAIPLDQMKFLLRQSSASKRKITFLVPRDKQKRKENQ